MWQHGPIKFGYNGRKRDHGITSTFLSIQRQTNQVAMMLHVTVQTVRVLLARLNNSSATWQTDKRQHVGDWKRSNILSISSATYTSRCTLRTIMIAVAM